MAALTETALALDVDRAVLETGLGAVAATAQARSPLPLTSCVLLEAAGDTLTLVTSNLDQETTCTLGLAAGVAGAGRCAVPLGLLRELVRELPARSLRLSVEDRVLRVAAGGYTAHFKLYPADEFPRSPASGDQVAAVEVRADVLRAQFARVVPAAASDDSRPVLNGILVRVREGALTLAAADGYRLAVAPDLATLRIEGAADAVVPLRAVRAFDAALAGRGEDAAALQLFGARAVLSAWPVRLSTRLVEGVYPNYPAILAQTAAPRWEAAFAVADLQAALRAESGIARDGANIVRLGASPDGLVVAAIASEVGDATVLVPAQMTGAHADQHVSANLTYLTDVLRVVGTPRARLRVTSPTMPVLFEPVDDDGYQHIVMPMATHAAPSPTEGSGGR